MRTATFLALLFLLVGACNVSLLADYEEEREQLDREIQLVVDHGITRLLLYERDTEAQSDVGQARAEMLAQEHFGGHAISMPIHLARSLSSQEIVSSAGVATAYKADNLNFSTSILHDLQDMTAILKAASDSELQLGLYKAAELRTAGGLFNAMTGLAEENVQLPLGWEPSQVVTMEEIAKSLAEFVDEAENGGHSILGIALFQPQCQLSRAVLSPDIPGMLASLVPKKILGKVASKVLGGDEPFSFSLPDLALDGLEIAYGLTLAPVADFISNLTRAEVTVSGSRDSSQVNLGGGFSVEIQESVKAASLLRTLLERMDTQLYVDVSHPEAPVSRRQELTMQAQHAWIADVSLFAGDRLRYSEFAGHGYSDAAIFLRGHERPNQAPLFGDLADLEIQRGWGGTQAITVFDWDGDNLRVSLAEDSRGLLFNVVSVPGRFTAEYQYVDTGAKGPGRFSVTLVASDLRSPPVAASFEVIVHNYPPETPEYPGSNTWGTVGTTEIKIDPIALTEPLMLTMDPEWYDVGCLQFRDLDGDALTFRVSPKPKKGRADLLVAGGGGRYSVTILYTIDREEALKDHRGEEPYVDRFSVVATDPSGEKAISNVEVTLEVLNSDPECAADEAETFAGVPLLIDAVANDTDPDEDALTITAVGDPAHGATEIVGNEIRYTPDGGYCGEDAFTYDVADGYGGSATGTVTITVLDTIPPVAVCRNATVFLDANGTAVLDPAALNNGSSDNCGIAGFSADPDTFSCGDAGDWPVTLTVTDHAGNTATCQATVTVLDMIAPVAVGQDVTVALDESGRASVDAYAVGAASTDNCGITSLTLSQAEFTCADLGANTVALTATDPSGNTNACTMTVTVIDTIPPTAVCQNLTVSLDADGVAVLDPAVVGAPSTDNCAIANYALDRDTFTCAEVGEHTVTVTVTDTSGLTDMCQATITVVDDLAPSIACPGSIFTAVTGSETSKTVSWTEPAITDNCGLLSVTATHAPGDSFPIGSTTVQYTATDIYGNVSICTFDVNVAEPLSLSCSDVSATTPDPNGTTVTFSPSVEGGCNPRVTCTPSSGSHFPVGTTQVSCTATGDCGGSDSCVFTVEVRFVNEPPVAVDDEVDMPQGGGCLTIPVLANDSDPDGHEIFVSWVGSPSCGTTAIVPGGGAIEYCTEGCSDPPDTVTFDYRISDGYAESAAATVSVDMPSGPIILFCPPPPPSDEEGKE